MCTSEYVFVFKDGILSCKIRGVREVRDFLLLGCFIVIVGIEVASVINLSGGLGIELITFEILAAERLRLMGFDNRLIIDCFANVVNILIW